jgi:hypothetical protein
MRSFLYSLILLLFFANSNAQKTPGKLQFSAINSIGLLVGDRGEAFAVQTIPGLTFKQWFAGVGTGLDFYEKRTIPLFFDIRQNLFKTANTPYLYVDAGTSFVWNKAENIFNQQDRSTIPRFNYETGIGYKLSVNNKTAMIFSAGYSYKQIEEKYKTFLWLPILMTSIQGDERYQAIYRRIVIRLGLQL